MKDIIVVVGFILLGVAIFMLLTGTGVDTISTFFENMMTEITTLN